MNSLARSSIKRKDIEALPLEIQFPCDESVHNHIVEWWYFNGHLKDKDGKSYSFMTCLFRVDVKEAKIPFLGKIPFRISYFSHSLLTDLNSKCFSHRMTPISLISDDSFSKPLLYINYINPGLRSRYVNCVIEKTGGSAYHLKNEDIDIRLTTEKKPLLEGGNGYIDLHSKATYYYSLTNLQTEGRVRVKNRWIDVTGKSWMDHQWANTSYSKDRWDWFSIQLDDDTEIVCFMYDDGKRNSYYADISYPDSSQQSIREVEIVPLEQRWTSPHTRASYPLIWKIRIPAKKVDLTLTALVENQEMIFGSINYWEGPLRVEGYFDGKKVGGFGFMELVGYPSVYNNVRHMKEEIGKSMSHLVATAKGRTLLAINSYKRLG